MKKMKLHLSIEKTTISKLTNLNLIKGGETIGNTDSQDIISRWPYRCPPIKPTTATLSTDDC